MELFCKGQLHFLFMLNKFFKAARLKFQAFDAAVCKGLILVYHL